MRLPVWAFVLVGCIDVRSFTGTWQGAIVAEPAVRQGFADDVQVAPLILQSVELHGISGQLTTSDGRFAATALVRVTKTTGDALASLSFDGDPLRTYVLFASTTSRGLPDGGGPALVLLSLFADQRIELRVLRGNELYGVFRLQRNPEGVL